MQAEKWVLETDAKGELHGLPPNSKVEVILVLNPAQGNLSKAKRKPHNKLLGKTQILGDIIEPAVPLADWDANL